MVPETHQGLHYMSPHGLRGAFEHVVRPLVGLRHNEHRRYFSENAQTMKKRAFAIDTLAKICYSTVTRRCVSIRRGRIVA